MADTEQLKYLWIVEWHNPFEQRNNRGLFFYRLTVLPGVKPEDFEAFVKNEAFPAVGKILTRAIQYERQYLIRDAGIVRPDPLDSHQVEDMVKRLGALATHTLEDNFIEV